MTTKVWTDMWGTYTPAMEAWQAFMMHSMAELGRASMMWMMLPLDIGQRLQSQSKDESGPRHLQSLLEHAMDTHKRAQAFANRAYASSLDAGYRSFRELEAAALDRGTYDGGIGHPARAA